ncbi:MAG: putative ABC transport system permease protein [Planctomycetota bacterium]|jgi:putative ABC transport system permease protein
MKFKSTAIHSYWLMFIATVITVGIVTSSQLITERISLLLERQASELLAADLVLLSNQDIDEKYRQSADHFNLKQSRSVSLRTAIFIDDSPQLIELKAVDSAYPLRGKLEVAEHITATKSTVLSGPGKGRVWVDSKLSAIMGSEIAIGAGNYRADKILTYEPDRGGTLFNLAPRILMNLQDLDDTGLVIQGSRVSYRMMFAGDERDVEAFKNWLKQNLNQGDEIQDLENARPEMRQALERTRKFFALAIVLTLIIAMVAIAITARYTANRETPKIAMLRAFGVSQFRLFKYYLLQLGQLWIAATLVGILLGWLTQFPLQWALDGLFGKTLPTVYSVGPYIIAMLVGLLALLGFSLPHLINATATPPMQVLRDVANRRAWWRGWLISSVAVVTVFLILILLMRSSLLATATLSIVLLCAFLLPLILGLMVKTLLLSSKKRFWLRQYLLSRLMASSRGSIYVMSGFSLVLIAILLISVVKDELIGAWQTQLPGDIPNYFLINIRSDEIKAIDEFLALKDIPSSSGYPLVRARLQNINSQSVNDIDFKHPRASHLVNHTFNISFADVLPDDNVIVAGSWDARSDVPQLSVEEGMSERLQLQLGDILELSIGAQSISVPVTSIRSVVWENFKPNFYLIANRNLLESMPQTWLLSALIKPENKPDLKQLLEQFPSVTLIDITELMARIQGIVDKASVALQFFFVFALASALLVLLAAIQAGKHEREIESSLLRALSAHSRQLYRVQILEFTLMGGLIGFFSATFASVAGWAISRFFFDIDYQFSISVWAYSLLGACLVLTVAGTLVSYRVYSVSPMKILRS